MNPEAIDAAAKAIAGYCAADWPSQAYEGEAQAALAAAAPYLIREARAAELETAADWWWAHIRALGLGTRKPIHWLRARAAAIRAGEA